MWFQEGDEGKIYHRPYYSSSAVDNLKLYANSRTIGKSDYLRLSVVVHCGIDCRTNG